MANIEKINKILALPHGKEILEGLKGMKVIEYKGEYLEPIENHPMGRDILRAIDILVKPL